MAVLAALHHSSKRRKTLSLSTIALIMGGVSVGLSLMVLMAPDVAMNIALKFPRSRLPAWILSAIDLVWSAMLLWDMPMGKLDMYKPLLYIITPLVFVMTVMLMDELLAPRALGGLFLLIASPILAVARLHYSPWRVVVPAITYLIIIAGMVLVMSPYYFRKSAIFLLHNKGRRTFVGIAGLTVACVLTVLSLTVY